MQISNAQSGAIAHRTGPAMVLAGPGSGKTLVITQRTKYLIESCGVMPQEILVITFTRAAALEMRSRFLSVCNASGVTFGTFHSVFFSVLKHAYHYSSANILSEEQKFQILRQLVREAGIPAEEEKELLADLAAGRQGQHASNLGGILAKEIGDSLGVPAYIVDPVSVDEMMPIARYSGVPELPRVSLFHALNQKAVARRYAGEQGVPYHSLNLIVAHMGGGVSVGAHEKGRVVDVFNEKQNAEVKKVNLNLGQIEKGGYPHFMLKEIFEQPECLKTCMLGRINSEGSHVTLSAVLDYRKQLISAKRIIIVACGTSWHAGLIGKQMIENLCRIPVEVEYASEFRYRNPVVGTGDVVIAISQSGETADTLAAVKLAKEKGAFIYGICNAVGSSIPRATDTGSYIHVGPEIGVASTKAFTGQVTVLTMLALALGNVMGTVSHDDYISIVKGLQAIPDKIREVLKLNERIADLSRTFTYARNFLYLGRGFSYPVALEGALKLKEISYIHAEGYPAAEMKHGPIALIDSDMPVVVIATHNDLYEKVLSNIQEIKARKGRVIALVSKGDDTISKLADEVIELPDTLECLEPLIATIPLQLMAYHVAVCKGKDVDQPRNLAKSVTVE